MKKILLISILFLCSCAALNSFLGIDDKGNDLPGDSPISLFSRTIQNMGPIGTLVAGVLTLGGTAYASNRKGHGTLKGVITGIQKAKDDMTDKEKEALVTKLKKYIPNKYHKVIKKIKDAL